MPPWEKYAAPEPAAGPWQKYADTPAETPVTAKGLYNAADIGLQEGVAGLAALPRTIGTLGAQGIQAVANYVGGKLGLPEDTRDLAKSEGLISLPTQESALKTIQSQFGGKPYTPQNTAEEYARTIGQFAPNVALGAGGIARGVLAPALASETAGQVFKGTENEGMARLAGALGGSILGGGVANTAARAGSYRGAPNLEQLKEAVDNGYSAARNSGVELHPSYISQGLTRIADQLTSGPDARSPRLIKETLGLLQGEAGALTPKQPGAMAAITGVAPTAKAPVDFVKLDALRRDLGEVARDFTKPTEAASARMAQNGIDELLVRASQTPGAVLSGDASMLAQTAQAARANAAAEFRLRAIEAAKERALNTAGATHSGRNVENAIRQEMRSFIRPNNKGISPARAEGFSPEEIAAVRENARGPSAANLLRTGGNLLGGGGGIASSGIGLAGILSGQPWLTVAAGGGLAARSLGNYLARQRADQLSRMIAARSPLGAGVSAGAVPRNQIPASLLSMLAGSNQ